MKFLPVLLCLVSSLTINAEIIGVDSGKRDIIIYSNQVSSDSTLLIIGAIHGDEGKTTQVVEYIRQNSNYKMSTYFIPTLNPTTASIKSNNNTLGRRGYLREHLDSQGFVTEGSQLENFNKGLFYRIFYGNEKTYTNGIDKYIDPNRDFNEMFLPSTRALSDLITKLKSQYKTVTILSLHGYMDQGRVYPEYVVKENEIIVSSRSWEMAKVIANASGYAPETIYGPSKPIIERFDGELICYTGKIEGVTAFDIEIDSNFQTDNKTSCLNGVNALVEFLLNEE